MTGDRDTLPLPLEPAPELGDGRLWLTATDLGELADISERNAREALKRCVEGGSWRGHQLQVRTVDTRGGKAGKSYQVHAASLPFELAKRFRDTHADLFKAPEPNPANIRTMPEPVVHGELETLAKHVQLAKWKVAVIEPALIYPKKSRGRGETIRYLSRLSHTRPDGKVVTVGQLTLYKWIASYEEHGLNGLIRKPRVEKKPNRWILCRTWDTACPLPEPKMREISAIVHQHVKNLWAAGVPSRDKVEAMASTRLLELSREAGWADVTLEQCRVGRHVVEMHQRKRLIAIADKDAKRFSDRYKPRIKRTRKGLRPGDVIVGDVHPVDILVRRADGSEATPRMIAWYDLATNECFYTLVLLNPREGIKQADIARSFTAMCMKWGLPRFLYLDNGSEYSWKEMEQGFAILTALVRDFSEFEFQLKATGDLVEQFADPADRSAEADDVPQTEAAGERSAIVRALPYNAAAKPIEGGFSAIEKILSMLPGYIGGDRMNKRTHRVGKGPKPYPGTWEAFQADFAAAMAYYHSATQRGSLNGLSPDARRKAFEADGFQMVRAPLVVFLLALSEVQQPTVTNQGIPAGGRWYYSDALLPYVGQKVFVRLAKWAPELIILDRGKGADGGRFAAIFERPEYGVLDGEGAREGARRGGVLRDFLKEERRDVSKLDLVEDMRRHVATMGERSTDSSTNDRTRVAEIGLVPELQTLADQIGKGNPNPRRPLRHLERLDRKTGEIHSIVPELPPPEPEPQVYDIDAMMDVANARMEAERKQAESARIDLDAAYDQVLKRTGNE